VRNLFLLALILVAAVSNCDAQTRGGRTADRARYAARGFIENKGQFAEGRGRATPTVLFKGSVEGVDVYLTTDGVSYVFAKFTKEGERAGDRQRPGDGLDAGERGRVEWRRVDMRLAGARIRKENVSAERPVAQGYFNYYLTHCPQGVTKVYAFHQVTVREIYPGIDWRLTDDETHGFKNEFLIHPGASPNDIGMVYTGAGNVAADGDGKTLRVRTALGEIEEGALLSHQGDPSQPVNSRYVVSGSAARFAVGRYDARRDLVVDPPLHLVWATLYGGNRYDGPWSLATDAANNLYVVGYTGSTDFPTQPAGSAYLGLAPASGAFQTAFIIKFDHNGARQWATYYGSSTGSGQDIATGVVADKFGNLYVAGQTTAAGNDFPTMPPAGGGVTIQATNAGGPDAFLLKFDAAGVREWATLYGGSGYDAARGVTSDPAGNVYTVGLSVSPDLPTTPPPGAPSNWQSVNAGGMDAFVMKHNPSGTREWAMYYGGSDIDYGLAITWHNTAAFAGVCVTGTTRSPDLPLKSVFASYNQPAMGGTQDAFILAVSVGGSRAWATYYGGAGEDYGLGIASGWNYALYVTGRSNPVANTPANSFPTQNPGGGAYYQPAYSLPPPYSSATSYASVDAFVLMFGPGFGRLWATLFGGTSFEYGNGVVTDSTYAQGRVHITGSTASTDLPVYNPGGNVYFDGTYNGGDDVFLATFSRTGVQEWTTYVGGGGSDYPRSIGASGLNCLFVTGEFNSQPGTLPLLDPGGVYFQNTSSISNGNWDEGFVAKFCY
jgi:hypothetical protein